MQANKLTRALLTGTFLVALTGSALALDGKDFVKSLNAVVASSGGSLVTDTVDVDGDTIVLHGARMKVPGGDSLGIGDMTYSGVEKSGDGGYSVDTLTMPDLERSKDGTTISVKNIHADGLSIPPASQADDTVSYVTYQSAGAGPLTVSDAKGEIVSIEAISTTLQALDGDKGYTSKTSATGLAIHTGRLKHKVRKAAKAMGYDVVKGRFEAQGRWEAESGHVSVSDFSLALDNVGTLHINFDLSGYTPEFVRQLRDLGAKARAKPDDPKAKQALGIGMLGLIQQLKFGGASVRFEDDSVTRKSLAYVGKDQGMSADQMANAAEAMLPMVLGKLQNPQFQKAIADAVNAYLDDPKNIEIEAAPANPIAFPMIVGAAMSSPQTLPDVLNVDVQANQ